MPNTTAVRTAQVGAAPLFAGKNKIINGDFGVWQRGTSVAISADIFLADRFISTWAAGGASGTWSRQTFTPGAAPVSGYEGLYFSRFSATSGSGTTEMGLQQRIENVQTLAGQTATFSFWAKADSARTATIYIDQNFGSGGSASVVVNNSTFSVTTSWTRFTVTVSVPSVSGKTIGTSSYLRAIVYYTTGQASGSPTLDTWGWQLESGSTATAFQTATGTIQGELAACQRYYFRSNNGGNAYARYGIGRASSSTNIEAPIYLPVPMRVAPSSVDFSNLTTTTANNISAVALNQPTTNVAFVDCTASSLTTGQAVVLMGNNSTAAYIGFSAEL